MCVWKSEDNFVKLVLSFYLYMGSADCTQSLEFPGKAISPACIKSLACFLSPERANLLAYQCVYKRKTIIAAREGINKGKKSEKINNDYVTAQVKGPGYRQRSRSITSLSDAKGKRDTLPLCFLVLLLHKQVTDLGGCYLSTNYLYLNKCCYWNFSITELCQSWL